MKRNVTLTPAHLPKSSHREKPLWTHKTKAKGRGGKDLKGSTPFFHPLLILALAGSGQWFLSQWEKPFTLIPGLLFYALAAYLFLKTLPPLPRGPQAEGRASMNFIALGRQSGQRVGVPGRGLRFIETQIGPGAEGLWFFLVMGLAAFFRLYQLESIPPGLWIDSGSDGLGGLRILYEHWRPFLEGPFSTHPAYLYYLAAFWFKWMDPTVFSLRSFYVLLALAAFPFIYWTFRQLAGPRTALMALFILAVMRCDASYSHLGYPVNHVAFFIFGTLAFWLYAFRTHKVWAFGLSAAFFAVGFYTYHGYKIFALLVLAVFLYEFIKDRRFGRDNAKGLGMGALVLLALMGPLLAHWFSEKSLGSYEMGLFIGPKLWAEKSLWPFLQNIGDFAMLFNRHGDRTSYDNFQGHRMLDDITGIFLVLGLALSVWRFKERPYFYALMGFVIISLNGLLTLDATLIRRLLSETPFIALLAALALQVWLARVKSHPRSSGLFLAGLLGMLMVGQNFYQYFFQLAKDPVFRKDSDIATTNLGQRIVKEGAQYDFCLDPRYDQHRTVHFLAYFHQKDYSKMDWPQGLVSPTLNPGKAGVCFVLDEGEYGVVDLLKNLYPQARVEVLKDSEGGTLNTYLYVSRESLEAMRQRVESGKNPLTHGLKAEYFRGSDRIPIASRWDPLVNFTNKNDFLSVQGPMGIQWTGALRVPRTGRYDLVVLTEEQDQATLTLDGKNVLSGGPSPSGSVELTKGSHRLSLQFKMSTGWFSAATLAWKQPGQEKFQVIPTDFFGLAAPHSILTH